MGDFVKGIIGALTGSSAKEAKKASEEQKAAEKVAQDRQLAALNDEEKRTATGRAPRGRRLLINDSTGEAGVSGRSDKLGP